MFGRKRLYFWLVAACLVCGCTACVFGPGIPARTPTPVPSPTQKGTAAAPIPAGCPADRSWTYFRQVKFDVGIHEDILTVVTGKDPVTGTLYADVTQNGKPLPRVVSGTTLGTGVTDISMPITYAYRTPQGQDATAQIKLRYSVCLSGGNLFLDPQSIGMTIPPELMPKQKPDGGGVTG